VFTNQLQRKLTRRCSEVATSTKHYSDSGFLIIQAAKSTLTDCGFVPIADIVVFHNERPLSDAERNSLKKPSSFCVFFELYFRELCIYTKLLCFALFAVIRFFVNPYAKKLSNQVTKFSLLRQSRQNVMLKKYIEISHRTHWLIHYLFEWCYFFISNHLSSL